MKEFPLLNEVKKFGKIQKDLLTFIGFEEPSFRDAQYLLRKMFGKDEFYIKGALTLWSICL